MRFSERIMEWRPIGKGRGTIGVVLYAGSMALSLGGCTALLDWHLHDSKVSMEEKSVEIEGEPATNPCPHEECVEEPRYEIGDEVGQDVERDSSWWPWSE